jgi:hypothetical protein
MLTQRLVLRNDKETTLVVYVEINPDRYELPAGSVMVIEADLGDAPFDVAVFPTGIQVYPGKNSQDPVVTIDGLNAVPWLPPTVPD